MFGLDVGNQPMGQMKFDSVGGKFYKANFEGADLNIASFLFGDLREANLKNTKKYRDWETDRKSTRLNSSHRL